MDYSQIAPSGSFASFSPTSAWGIISFEMICLRILFSLSVRCMGLGRGPGMSYNSFHAKVLLLFTQTCRIILYLVSEFCRGVLGKPLLLCSLSNHFHATTCTNFFFASLFKYCSISQSRRLSWNLKSSSEVD